VGLGRIRVCQICGSAIRKDDKVYNWLDEKTGKPVDTMFVCEKCYKAKVAERAAELELRVAAVELAKKLDASTEEGWKEELEKLKGILRKMGLL
jgi:hypothetical protein